MNFPGIQIGAHTTVHHTVTEADTVGNHLPDDMEKLFSTPSLVSLMIEASVQLIDSALPDGFISIGKSAGVIHEGPSVVGSTVALRVSISSFDGYHITIAMEAFDGDRVVGRGTHVRSIVNKRWMQLKVAKRIASLQ